MTGDFQAWYKNLRDEMGGDWWDEYREEFGDEQEKVTVISQLVGEKVFEAIEKIVKDLKDNGCPLDLACQSMKAFFEGQEVDDDSVEIITTVYEVKEIPAIKM